MLILVETEKANKHRQNTQLEPKKTSHWVANRNSFS